MPLKWFICPDGGQVDVSACVAGHCRMGSRCAPLQHLRVAGRQREWNGKPSVTQLIKGTREAFLEIMYDYAVDPDSRAFAVLGTAAHAALEGSSGDFSIVEENIEIDGITGRSDLLEQQEDGSWVLWDHKTSGSYKVAKAFGLEQIDVPVYDDAGRPIIYKSGKKKGCQKTRKESRFNPEAVDMDDWIKQLNMYRIGMERSLGEKIGAMKIFAVVRDGGTYIAQNRGLDKNTYAITIPFLNDSDVLDFFTAKRETLLHHVKTQTLPPLCSEEENWNGTKCRRFCNVTFKCAGNPYLLEDAA